MDQEFTSSGNGSQGPRLSELGDRMREDFSLLGEALRRETQGLRETVSTMVNEHPYATMGAAFGVGFLLAGGLFSRTTARTLSFGTRFLVGKLLRMALMGAGTSFLASEELRRAVGTPNESTP